MTKKILIVGVLLLIASLSAQSQLYSFGVKGGLGISSYNLSNGYVFYQTDGKTISFHTGIFARRHFGKFFVQGDIQFTTGMKANLNFRNHEYSFSKSALSVPITFGRSFYPGNIRIYTGLSPSLYFGKEDIESYLTDNKLLILGNSGSSQSIGYIGGVSIDIAKITIDLRYEGPLLGGFLYEDKKPDITTFHRFSSINMGLAYKLQ